MLLMRERVSALYTGSIHLSTLDVFAILRNMSQIRKHREMAGLTRDQLAKRLKASEFTVRSWEIGQRNPPVKRLKQIARALRCEAAELL